MINKLKELLKNGIAEFDFEKKDGTIRHAKGTTNFDVCKESSENFAEPKGVKTKNPDFINYWDIEKESWRSFNSNQLIKVYGY
jgi:hypothetical protein